MKHAVVLVLVVGLGGCATLFASKTDGVQATSDPVGAEVWVNGARVGQTPINLRLSRDRSHTITLKAPGRAAVSCIIGRSVGAGWVILDILAGLVPVVIDAVTGDWYSLDQSHCHQTLPPG